MCKHLDTTAVLITIMPFVSNLSAHNWMMHLWRWRFFFNGRIQWYWPTPNEVHYLEICANTGRSGTSLKTIFISMFTIRKLNFNRKKIFGSCCPPLPPNDRCNRSSRNTINTINYCNNPMLLHKVFVFILYSLRGPVPLCTISLKLFKMYQTNFIWFFDQVEHR